MLVSFQIHSMGSLGTLATGGRKKKFIFKNNIYFLKNKLFCQDDF